MLAFLQGLASTESTMQHPSSNVAPPHKWPQGWIWDNLHHQSGCTAQMFWSLGDKVSLPLRYEINYTFSATWPMPILGQTTSKTLWSKTSRLLSELHCWLHEDWAVVTHTKVDIFSWLIMLISDIIFTHQWGRRLPVAAESAETTAWSQRLCISVRLRRPQTSVTKPRESESSNQQRPRQPA